MKPAILTGLLILGATFLCGASARAQQGFTRVSTTSEAPVPAPDDLFKPIAKYFGVGDTDRFSAWMAPNVEVSIFSHLTNTSKAHAVRILDNFFRDYKPQSFRITHVASQVNLKYAFGILSAGGENFEVTLFAAYTGESFQIQQIIIDRSTSIF